MSTSVRVRVISGVAASVTGPSPVTSVAGRTGAVVLTVSDVSGAQAETASSIGTLISGAASKATPANADGIAISDSAASGILKNLSWSNLKAAISAALDGIFAKLTGLAGGQTLIGGTAASENLTLQSTSHATRGKLLLGSSSAYDEANVRIGVGTQAPSAKIHSLGTTEQLRLGYDASNYCSLTVSNAGKVTYEATGGTHSFKSSQSLPTLSAELLSNNSFTSNLSGWTDSGSSWSWSSGSALHTAGSASALSQSVSGIASGTSYWIDFTISGRNAGSVTLTLGSVTLVDYNTITTFSSSSSRCITAADSGSVAFTITPSTDFDGKIDVVSLKAITLGTVNAALTIMDSQGASTIEVRGGLSVSQSIALGSDSLRSLMSSSLSSTTAIGFRALYSAVSLQNVVAVGYQCAFSANNCREFVAVGARSAFSLTTGSSGVHVGMYSSYSCTVGNSNVAIGYAAHYLNQTASQVVSVGRESLRNHTTGNATVGIGNSSGRFIADGSTSLTSATNCVYIGASTKASADSVTNENVFGYNATGIGSNSTCIGSSAVTKCQIYGDMILDKTITAGGTTGAQTINKTCGSVNFAASATSLVVTNNRVTTSSVIVATVATNDSTMKTVLAVPASGSFTLYANAAATAETRVNWIVLN